jgi:hypothetical protein
MECIGRNRSERLTFNFANPASGTNPLNHASTFNRASVFFDFGTAGSGKTFYFDDVKFLGAVDVAPAPPPPPPPAPTAVTVSFDSGDTSGFTLGHPEDLEAFAKALKG